MDIGTKIKKARLEAGLSQRQLCGEQITRNMLSRIENGAARPSMDTLRFLAGVLGKPVSFFLEEDGAVSRNLSVMEAARNAWAHGFWQEGLEELERFQLPDPVLLPEKTLLECNLLLKRAQTALEEDRQPYARELLGRAEEAIRRCPYHREDLRHRALLLRGRLAGEDLEAIARQLPSLDEELLLRARGAGNPREAAALLDAARDKVSPRWLLCRGAVYLEQKDYARARICYEAVESERPLEAARALEICCRELGDYQGAYGYACKVRSFCE